jgi:peptidoglycan/LPS O-acetylase OafA/YrhL
MNAIEIVIEYVLSSWTLKLYVASSIVLVIGICSLIWFRVFRLSFLENVRLNIIETTHPHLPSPAVVISIILCCAALLAAALHLLSPMAPLDAPAAWIIAIAIFTLGGTFGVIAETRRKNARLIVAACIGIGAVALLAWTFHRLLQSQGNLRPVAALPLLGLCAVLVWGMSLPERQRSIAFLATVMCGAWLVLFFLLQ